MLLRTIAKSTPATLAVGPNKYGYLFQGNGIRPSRIDLTNAEAVDMGIDAPNSKPSVTPSGTPKSYVARIDVIEGGNYYTSAPKVTIDGGSPDKVAKARAFLTGNAVGDFSMLEYGEGYESTPTVILGDQHSKFGALTATLDGDTPDPTTPAPSTGTPTAIGKWRVTARPSPYVCLPAVITSGVGTQLLVPGMGNLIQNSWFDYPDMNGSLWSYVGLRGSSIQFVVQVAGSTSAARVLLTFGTRSVDGPAGFSPGVTALYPAGSPSSIEIMKSGQFVTVQGRPGGGQVYGNDGGGPYDKDVAYEIHAPGRLAAGDKPGECGGSSALRIAFYSNESTIGAGDDTAPTYAIKSVKVDDGGTGFTIPPFIQVDDASGYGAVLETKIKDGKIESVSVLKGGSYASPPKLSVPVGGAKAVAIIRPHIRGKYDCYYRYVDDTPEDRGGPICSSLSPVTTIDTGEGAEKLTWVVAAPPPASATQRPLKVELWRTTSDQAYTVYRVASGVTSFTDKLSDQQLTDYDRAGYAAMPVLLPNGELNANRFGVPPKNKTVAVMFQDRLWMAVDTGGNSPNRLKFSEYNEPESCPDINQINIQTNVKGHDHITALIPYGSSLGVMQTRHSYRLSYVSQPIIDANVQIAAYRGCLNQRCWDEFEGLVYCMDTQGVYAMDASGQVQPLSLGIRSLFDDKIDFAQDDWFSVTADRKTRCLRVAVRFKGDGPGKYPTRMLCFSFDAQGWWEERYPAALVGSATVRDAAGVSRCLYGGPEGKLYEVNSGDTDVEYDSIQTITLTNPGKGYTKTPQVTISGNGDGAVAEAAISGDGTLLGVYLRYGGYGYTTASVSIDPPPAGGVRATATCTVGDNNSAPIPCWFKSGNMEYPHDSLPVEMADKNRNVGLLFTPTAGPSLMKLRMYYNNSPHPRVNVAARDRGTGVVYQTQEPCVTLDMDAGLLPDRISTGVCRALFSSHTVDDIQGNDRHVAIELSAERSTTGPIEIHSVDVFGTPGA
jgi:hypothetical protein